MLIEAAFAIPIFFLLVFGLVDIGLLVLQKSQATNAAVDGARVGIIRWEQADVAGSDDREAIEAAVRARLPGQEVTIEPPRCLTTGSVVIACSNAEEGDRIEIEVSWKWDRLSPVGYAIPGNRFVTGRSTMAIIPQPTASSSPVPPAP